MGPATDRGPRGPRRPWSEVAEVRGGGQVASAVEFLGPFIVASIDNVAPEKGAALLEIMKELGAGITFSAENRNYCDLVDRRIVLGIPALELVWALSYSYYCFYAGFVDQKNHNPHQTFVDLRAGGRFRSAGRLLSWALERELSGKIEEWPTGAPRPEHASGTNDVKAANEIFLVAIGYLLHHELAHLKFKHRGFPKGLDPVKDAQLLLESRLQEKEADREAAAWLLDSVDDGDFRKVKRGLGMALGLSWLCMQELYGQGPLRGGTHPPGSDRLFQNVSQHFSDENSVVWAYVASLLFLHLQHAKAPVDMNREFASFKAAVSYCIDITASQALLA